MAEAGRKVKREIGSGKACRRADQRRPGYIDTPLNDMLKHRPFLVPVEKGAAMMAGMIERQVKSSTVPVWPWRFLGPMLRWLPTGVIARF